MADASKQREKVQSIYSQDSEYYITSTPHARSSSLARAVEVLQPKEGIHLDVATGAGHTAFAVAERGGRVIASDLTEEMLRAARKFGTEKGVKNASFLRTDAENLGLGDAALDSVSVRIAPHHFADVQKAIGEMARVLKPGGRLVYVDNIAPEDPGAAQRYNDFEKKRDPSHNRCDSMPELVRMIERAGLEIRHTETVRKKMVMEEWLNRPHLDDADKDALRAFLRDTDPAVREWLEPREEAGALVFDEVEAIILATRP